MNRGESSMVRRRTSRWSARGPGFGTLLMALAAPTLLIGLAGCGGAARGTDAAAGGDGDAILAAAFRDRAQDLQVQDRGIVVRLLSDDTDGARHQRFIVRLDSGQTLLVAHNIDVAPRVEGLAVGDDVAFSGVYEWSAEGGTIHWTHRDPEGRHASGWLRHGEQAYE
jgi:hypothetical protein